uniref:Sm domain-containing protein n=1 Tax=Lutzomyia longipalpis TaxID=7200 RepID=A0A1B0CQA2_LUTLO
MIQGHKRAKNKKNVLNICENFKGPLKLLHEFMQNKTQVKIYIRNNHGIRGYVTGYIEIFDKHWNVTLKDAEEFYRRRKFQYCESANFDESSVEDCSARLKKLGIELPEVNVKSINRKNVECRRKLPQILIRGEQIALITRNIEPP